MDALEWLSTTLLAVQLRRSAILYMLVNAAHILAICLLIGTILPLDLRLLGVFRSVPVEIIGPFLSGAAAIGVALAILTGFCLFSVQPMEYAGNAAFLSKLGLLALGLLNVVLVHAGSGWRLAVSAGIIRPGLRLSAALSLVIWIAALIAGRWIGFL